LSIIKINTEETKHQSLLYQTRSEEVQDIMGRMPSWLVRYGVIMIACILVLLFTGSYFLRYPDKIQTQLVITSNNPPVRIVAEQSGRINTIFVKQNDLVAQNSELLSIENAAQHLDIKELDNLLQHYIQENNHLNQFPKRNFVLGILQVPYEELLMSIAEWNDYLKIDNSSMSVVQLEEQLKENNTLQQQLLKNEINIKTSNNIDKKLFENESKLFKKQAITEEAYLMSKKKWIDQQMNLNSNKNNLVSTRIKRAELQKGIIDIQQERNKTLLGYKRKVELQMKALHQQIELWERTYTVKSPIAGNVNLYSIWKENQYIQAGQPILLIVPSTAELIVKGYLPVQNSGLVKTGQHVLISLASHPPNEFGYIEGYISYIAAAPLDSVYSFDVILKQGLKTSNNKTILQQPEMFGMGEILTDDKNVLQRLFEQFKK